MVQSTHRQVITEDFIFNIFTTFPFQGYEFTKVECVTIYVRNGDPAYRESWVVKKNGVRVCSFEFFGYSDSRDEDIVRIYDREDQFEENVRECHAITSSMIESITPTSGVSRNIMDFIQSQDIS